MLGPGGTRNRSPNPLRTAPPAPKTTARHDAQGIVRLRSPTMLHRHRAGSCRNGSLKHVVTERLKGVQVPATASAGFPP